MKKLSAYPVFLIYSGVSALSLSVAFTSFSIYCVQTVGLNPFQLVLIGTVLEVSAFLFETPTGVVADVYSRRLSVIVGVFLLGLSIFWVGVTRSFSVILLTQVVAGLGYTFMSGAEQAWISDEVGEAAAGRAFLRQSQVSRICSFVGVFASVGLASVALSLPIIVGGVAVIGIGVFLAIVMPETGFKPAPKGARSSWGQMGDTFRSGLRTVRGRPTLITILAIGVFFGLSSEGPDRLWEAHLLKNFTFPELWQFEYVVWFGLIRAVEMLLSITAVEFIRRRVDTTNHRAVATSLLVVNACIIAAMVTFGLAGNFTLAIASLWAMRICRTVSSPINQAWINQHTEAKVRATVFSMAGQVDAFGQMVGGPIVGAIGAARSIRAALVASGALLSPVLPLFARTIGQDRTKVQS